MCLRVGLSRHSCQLPIYLLVLLARKMLSYGTLGKVSMYFKMIFTIPVCHSDTVEVGGAHVNGGYSIALVMYSNIYI